MTVRNDQPPLSRRELRDRSRAESSAPVQDEEAEATAASAADDASAPPTGKRRSLFAPRSDEDVAIKAEEDAPDDATAPSSAGDGPASAEGDDRDGWRRPLPSDLDAPERTMTRRELRILRERAEAAGQPAPDVVFLPSGEATVTGMIPLVDVASADESHTPVESGSSGDTVSSDEAAPEAELIVAPEADPAGADALAPEADPAGVVTEEPIETPAIVDQPVIPALIEPLPTGGIRFRTDAGRPDDIALPITAPEQADPLTVDDDPQPSNVVEEDSPPEIVVDAEPVTGPVADQGVEQAPSPTLTPFDAMFRPPSSAPNFAASPVANSSDAEIDTSALPLVSDSDGVRSDILAAPDSTGRPFGHWSTQAAEDPDLDPETALSRDVGVGTGAITTHALVLPSIPDAGDPLLSPLTSTGEIMVTGTIDLPRTYGSTGAHPALFDHPDVDSLLDEADREDAEAAVAPVRAIRAVSSTTTTRAMIGSDEVKKFRWLPIVLIGAGIVFVGAVAFVIAAFLLTPS